MCDLIRGNYVRETGSFFPKLKEEKIGQANLQQSVKTEYKNNKTEIDKQIKNSEIDGKNNLIITSNSNTTAAAIVNLSVDKATLSKVAVGDYVKMGKIQGHVEFIDNADDDQIIKNNTINVKVDESNKLFGINGKSTEIYGR